MKRNLREVELRPVKIQIASDLHLEFYPPSEAARYRLPDVGADVLVLAGDVHTHDALDYVVDWSDSSGGTRVVCNPRGYPHESGTGFDPAKIVVV